MLRKATVWLIGSSLAIGGCATGGAFSGMDAKTCAVIGALAGGGAGVAIANPNHTKDDHEQGVVGAAAGALVGGALGYWLCSAEPPPQLPPQARATATPGSGTAPLEVELRGVGTDADGQIASYAWDLGDGTSASGQRVAHRYTSPGRYTARLTVTDDDGLTGHATLPIVVAAVPAPEPQVSRRIVLRGVNFDLDSAVIRPEGAVILQAAAEVLNENAGVDVIVTGHTDSTGSDSYNQGLSERRARAVRDHLVRLGVSASRLSVAGSGEARPVADNGTADGRAQNRRVVLDVGR